MTTVAKKTGRPNGFNRGGKTYMLMKHMAVVRALTGDQIRTMYGIANPSSALLALTKRGFEIARYRIPSGKKTTLGKQYRTIYYLVQIPDWFGEPLPPPPPPPEVQWEGKVDMDAEE